MSQSHSQLKVTYRSNFIYTIFKDKGMVLERKKQNFSSCSRQDQEILPQVVYRMKSTEKRMFNVQIICFLQQQKNVRVTFLGFSLEIIRTKTPKGTFCSGLIPRLPVKPSHLIQGLKATEKSSGGDGRGPWLWPSANQQANKEGGSRRNHPQLLMSLLDQPDGACPQQRRITMKQIPVALWDTGTGQHQCFSDHGNSLLREMVIIMHLKTYLLYY